MKLYFSILGCLCAITLIIFFVCPPASASDEFFSSDSPLGTYVNYRGEVTLDGKNISIDINSVNSTEDSKTVNTEIRTMHGSAHYVYDKNYKVICVETSDNNYVYLFFDPETDTLNISGNTYVKK